MRPLFHPPIEGVTVEAILHALSDPVRVAIFTAIVNADCATSCSTFLKLDGRTIPKSSLSQHLKVLREAGLIRGERRGVEVLNTSRCAEIATRFPGLIPAIVNAHRVQATEKTAGARTSRKPGAASPTAARRRRACACSSARFPPWLLPPSRPFFRSQAIGRPSPSTADGPPTAAGRTASAIRGSIRSIVET